MKRIFAALLSVALILGASVFATSASAAETGGSDQAPAVVLELDTGALGIFDIDLLLGFQGIFDID